MKHMFLDLGKQPLANALVDIEDVPNEYFYDLRVTFDDETKLVSLETQPELGLMFNDDYPYWTGNSKTMQHHFKEIANDIKLKYESRKILEIGSNDGTFLKHFNPKTAIAIEPCSNFAKITTDMGYHTYPEFLTSELADKVLAEYGKQDVIYSANCMCHIPNISDAFSAVSKLLNDSTGVFIFDDPSLLKMVANNSYDQIYDEHAHIFSVIALSRLLDDNGLAIFRVQPLSTHGGSNRIYVKKKTSHRYDIHSSVTTAIELELFAGLDKLETYQAFAERVAFCKAQLVAMLMEYKYNGKKIVAYGATSKSTTIYNYCNIGVDFIDYIVDTTPAKQGKYSPGMHIPIVPYSTGFDDTVDVAFLAAWNYEKEICDKERKYMDRGGIFIKHVPICQAIEGE